MTVASETIAGSVTLRRVSPACGAFVEGIDLRREQPDSVIAQLESALHEHGVLFFRDQPLTPAQHVAFGARFGPLHIHPYVQSLGRDHPEVIVLDEGARGAVQWHSDSSYEALPAYGSVLRAVRIPSIGGDTLWASMYAAYDALSSAMQRFLDGLHALHSIDKVRMRRDTHHPDKPSLSAEHPVVITDPVTRRKALYVNDSYTMRIQELSAAEDEKIMSMLREHIKAPEFQVRLCWEVDTVAFWHNPVTQHYPVDDYDEPRTMHRVTVQMSVPLR